jgi:hypothetical protein
MSNFFSGDKVNSIILPSALADGMKSLSKTNPERYTLKTGKPLSRDC